MSSSSSLADFAARLRAVIQVCRNRPHDASTELPSFNQLALDLFALQFEHNVPYRRFCEAQGAWPGKIARWTDIPAVPSSAFKECELSCIPVEERTAVFHSSGTTEQRPSRHFHHASSMAGYEESLLSWFRAQWPRADGQWQMAAILTPPPIQAPHSSLVHMFETIRRERGFGESSFLGRLPAEDGWKLESDALVQVLREVSSRGWPLLIMGTAFSFVHLLDHLAERGLRFALPPGSCAFETGGYKGRSRALPKDTLHGLISQRLGIPLDHILCEYGMSELSSQAYERSGGVARNTQHATRCFAFPPWARVQIISPETGAEVADGETGLIRIFDLANVWSVMAIQTEDLGVRYGSGFTLAGRAVFAEPRGCSLMAV
jgi:hypothetical protein